MEYFQIFFLILAKAEVFSVMNAKKEKKTKNKLLSLLG